jgi:hypothetical protein
MRRFVFASLLVLFIAVSHAAAEDAKRFPHGLSADPGYFPIAVWLQDARNAPRYKDMGVNLYIGQWEGPTEKQLAELDKAGMQLICDQNAVALKHLDSKTIVGWMHGDEPDNAQEKPKGQKGYDPPITPAKIVEGYEKMHKADPTRPVLLNLGQGVAWEGWHGRGVRSGHLEDYPEYVKGCDIVSFDIYPVTHDKKEIAGKLEYVPKGVQRLIEWTKNEKPVWTCIECTHIGNPAVKPTPQQVRSEVWMAIIHGSRGIVYFAHEFKPKFVEAGLLADSEMAAGVKAINAQITELAPMINSPALKDEAKVDADSIALMTRKYKGDTYVFAVAMTDKPTHAQFALKGAGGGPKSVEVIDEKRTIPLKAGEWSDEFKGYEVHLYRVGQ